VLGTQVPLGLRKMLQVLTGHCQEGQTLHNRYGGEIASEMAVVTLLSYNFFLPK